jgi:hypothetical protein
MYGSKEETNDTEDFYPFVCVQLTSPIFLQWKKNLFVYSANITK